MTDMDITGYKLREAIKRWTIRRDALDRTFRDALFSFDGEIKEKPETIMASFVEAEEMIAHLQTLQSAYNIEVKVYVGDKQMSLCQAVKMSGGVVRTEKLWRTATGEKDESQRYGIGPVLSRDKDTIVAHRTVTLVQALTQTERTSKLHCQLQSAISEGNAVRINMPDTDAKMFE